jgi:hypothetical protein
VGPQGPAGHNGVDGKNGMDGKEVDTVALMSQLETRFRKVWKNDIQSALRSYSEE